jgi:hypothetical protein
MIGDDDLRAGVAAGILTEAQASRLLTLTQTRAGTRAALTGEDEPFELFRGFSEIFISVGLVILLSGIMGLVSLSGHVLAIALAGAALAVLLALYFTRRRRMTLPSIVLSVAFAQAISAAIAWIVIGSADIVPGTPSVILIGSLVVAALAAWYWAFRIPFTMFLIGLTVLAVILLSISGAAPVAIFNDWSNLFDLGGSLIARGTLAFGIVAFIAGMAFDMRDPHRLGRFAASGFWLHLLAAPALVNTVALTFLNMDNTRGYILLGLSLALITLLALVIDRRSFLTAGIAYLGILLGLILVPDGGSPIRWAWLLIVLGGFVTLIGAFWTQWRSAILRALPDFPGKERLPPYTSTE